MKNKFPKGLLALTLAALLALSLCACGTPAEDTEQPEDPAGVEDVENKEPTEPTVDTPVTVDKDGYSFSLPEGCTTEDAGDGGVTILNKDGKEVGGVNVIPCTGAEGLKVSSKADLESDGYTVLAEQVAPGETGTFDIGAYGLFTYTVGDAEHTFFPKGDNLYDLWVQGLSDEEANAVLYSFTAKA